MPDLCSLDVLTLLTWPQVQRTENILAKPCLVSDMTLLKESGPKQINTVLLSKTKLYLELFVPLAEFLIFTKINVTLPELQLLHCFKLF